MQYLIKRVATIILLALSNVAMSQITIIAGHNTGSLKVTVSQKGDFAKAQKQTGDLFNLIGALAHNASSPTYTMENGEKVRPDIMPSSRTPFVVSGFTEKAYTRHQSAFAPPPKSSGFSFWSLFSCICNTMEAVAPEALKVNYAIVTAPDVIVTIGDAGQVTCQGSGCEEVNGYVPEVA